MTGGLRMDKNKEMIGIRIENNRLVAKIYLKEKDPNIAAITEQDIRELIQKSGISFGLLDWINSNWKEQLSKFSEILIAKGKPPLNGRDAELVMKEFTNKPDELEKRTFRDVTMIPMVEEGDLLARIVPAREGEPGVDVFNQPIKQRKGRPLPFKAGKNITYIEKEFAFRATAAGQLSVGDKRIDVYPLYEVNGDLSMETGNIYFNGSVTVKGNVPTGYQVKAEGDVTVYGIVEGAYISAGENVFIKEGIAGMEKAVVQAKANIEATYINQAEVTAGCDIRVRKSIMHSICLAEGNILCKQGVIIGGSASSGQRIEVKDLGNVANSKTELAFGINKQKMDRVYTLRKEQNQLAENKQKLKMLGDQLRQKKETVGELITKERIMLLKQRNMFEKISAQLQHIKEELEILQYEIGNNENMRLAVTGTSYENVELTFGKYKRLLKQEYRKYQAHLEGKEIIIEPL